MTIGRVKAGGWATNEKLTSLQQTDLDINVSYALDRRAGFSDTLSSQITLPSTGSITWTNASSAVFQSSSLLNLQNSSVLQADDGSHVNLFGITNFENGSLTTFVSGSQFNGTLAMVGAFNVSATASGFPSTINCGANTLNVECGLFDATTTAGLVLSAGTFMALAAPNSMSVTSGGALTLLGNTGTGLTANGTSIYWETASATNFMFDMSGGAFSVQYTANSSGPGVSSIITGQGSAHAGSAGGDVSLIAGSATVGSSNGGNLYLTPGLGHLSITTGFAGNTMIGIAPPAGLAAQQVSSAIWIASQSGAIPTTGTTPGLGSTVGGVILWFDGAAKALKFLDSTGQVHLITDTHVAS